MVIYMIYCQRDTRIQRTGPGEHEFIASDTHTCDMVLVDEPNYLMKCLKANGPWLFGVNAPTRPVSSALKSSL
jgi:hypothetical protein